MSMKCLIRIKKHIAINEQIYRKTMTKALVLCAHSHLTVVSSDNLYIITGRHHFLLRFIFFYLVHKRWCTFIVQIYIFHSNKQNTLLESLSVNAFTIESFLLILRTNLLIFNKSKLFCLS